jgi:hypothetical protein
MGTAYCAVSDDANAIQFNPGGLTQIGSAEINVSHNQWIEGINNDMLDFACPLSGNYSLGLSFNNWNIGGLTGMDNLGNQTTEVFSANSSVIALSLAKKINSSLSAGINCKRIQESLGPAAATADAVDIGLLYKTKRLRAGAEIQNYGSRMKLYEESFPLPLTVILGMSFMVRDNIVIAVDQNFPADDNSFTAAGIEWSYTKTSSLRFGYRSDENQETLLGYYFGLGYHFSNCQIDYSLQPFGDLGDVNRISVTLKFGKNITETKKVNSSLSPL